jgi:site-specific DNA recombinase
MGEFRDIESGLHPDRPQYMQASALALSRGIDKLVVWRLDRLGRDSAEYIPLLKGLKRLGVDVVSVTQPAESMFLQQVIGLMAEEESRQLSIRVTASKQRRFKEGKWGSTPPFGYDTRREPDGGSVLVPNEEGPLVTEVFRMYASGRHSIRGVQRYLNEHGQSRSRSSLWHMLRNEVYVGLVKHGQFARSQFMPKPSVSTALGRHEPLTDRETFDRVQERLATNAHRQRGGVNPKYLFAGLIYCGNCHHKYVGRTLTRKNGAQWVSYRCNRQINFNDCRAHIVNESRVREAVIRPLERVLNSLAKEDINAAVQEELIRQRWEMMQGALQTKENLLETQKRLEGRLSRLEDSFLDGDLDRDRYLTRRDEIKGQLQDIKSQLAARPHLVLPDIERLFAISASLAEDLPGSLDSQSWRELIELLLEKVTISGHDVDVVWKEEFESMFELVPAS